MHPSPRKRRRRQTALDDALETSVERALNEAGITQTTTRSGWCLREGLLHICSVDDGHPFLPLLEQHGPPTFYHCSSHRRCRHHRHQSSSSASSATTNNMMKVPTTAFESLCRIIAGQQLAGAAAQAVWRRLLETTKHNLSPTTVIALTKADGGLVENLKKPAGLSLAKARSIVDLSEHFNRGDLSEDMLLSTTSSETDIRQALLQVRGLGPWSCDMFLMFYLEKSNVMPLGDLGVRKGLSKTFSLRGSAKHGTLCPKKDVERIQSTVQPFAPYQSLLSFYMWKAADTVDVYNTTTTTSPSNGTPTKKLRSKDLSGNVVTP